jgi:hypothetical protein
VDRELDVENTKLSPGVRRIETAEEFSHPRSRLTKVLMPFGHNE